MVRKDVSSISSGATEEFLAVVAPPKNLCSLDTVLNLEGLVVWEPPR